MHFKFIRVLLVAYINLCIVLSTALSAAESRLLNVDGHQIHTGFWGDVENNELPWAVLLSGPIGSWHSDTAWFASLAPMLAKYYRVIAIDRASLITDHTESPVGYAHFAIDIAEVLQQLKIKKTLVVGFASSNISLQLLLQHPEYQALISSVILIDPDVLTAFSSARYIEDAKPFKDNLDNYIQYIKAGKYTERVMQKNVADKQTVLALVKDSEKVDWQYLDSLFDARLKIKNQLNLFKEIAIYDQDLQEVMATNWPKQVPVIIFDTDFELEYIESAATEELKESLILWKEDAKRYYLSLNDLHPDNRYIETNSRSHLYQFEHPEKLIEAILKQSK